MYIVLSLGAGTASPRPRGISEVARLYSPHLGILRVVEVCVVIDALVIGATDR